MPKQVKITDELYDRLKKDADDNFRSLGGQIEFLMANQGGSKKSEPEIPLRKIISEATPRGKGEILQSIRDTEAERDEELRYCQDVQMQKEITNRYATVIGELWSDYHLTKENSDE